MKTINPQFKLRNDKGLTKHKDVRYHLIRDLVQSATIQLKYVPTISMVADILSKPLDFTFFIKFQAS